ncbi:MAG: DUF4350 domain-containing protein [Actinomycetota bacterium]|nr:DUF4350 domain-containing protein [Actinomycetota bacterium]
MNRRSSMFFLALGAALVVVALVLGRNGDGPPLDPASTGPLGTHAMFTMLGELGSGYDLGLPDDGDEVALLLAGELDADQVDALDTWIRRGGRLVVSSPGTAFSGGLSTLVSFDQLGSGGCGLEGFEDVVELEAPSFGTFAVDVSTEGCFGVGGFAYLVREEVGAGEIVALGGAAPFTNELLGEADNAVLAVRLLGPQLGPSRVADDADLPDIAVIYDPSATVVAGGESLLSLIPGRIRWLGWQLLAAFGVFVFWKARRFGRVVDEPQPVELPGSLLVLSSGELRRRSAGYDVAIAAIRRDTETRLRAAHRVPAEVPTERLVADLFQRHGLSEAALRRALLEPLPPEPDGLVSLTVAVDQLNMVDQKQVDQLKRVGAP